MRASLSVVRDKMFSACQKAGRPIEAVRLVAVTKKVDAERIREAAALGITDFGENYVQEAKGKIEQLGFASEVKWHMIGHVQTNKIKYIHRLFTYIHSVDRWEVLEGLERYGKDIYTLFEVNLGGEEQKHGTTPDGLRAMLDRAASLRSVKPVGLMTVPPFSDDPEAGRPIFAALRKLLDDVNREFGLAMHELSMGMSGDFDVAIEEGATMVRVGTALFGERS
jgi:PLP dependent protein